MKYFRVFFLLFNNCFDVCVVCLDMSDWGVFVGVFDSVHMLRVALCGLKGIYFFLNLHRSFVVGGELIWIMFFRSVWIFQVIV